MDGFEGLAAAILLSMVCMVVVPGLLFGALGWLVMRKKHGWLGALLGIAFGALLGLLGVAVTFFERDLTQAELILEAPPGFDHEWVVLLEDPTVSQEVNLSGWPAPSATLSVPASGVVRLRTLSGLAGEDVAVSLNGRPHLGMLSRPAPRGLPGGLIIAYGFAPYGSAREPDLGSLGETELVRRITELEQSP